MQTGDSPVLASLEKTTSNRCPWTFPFNFQELIYASTADWIPCHFPRLCKVESKTFITDDDVKSFIDKDLLYMKHPKDKSQTQGRPVEINIWVYHIN